MNILFLANELNHTSGTATHVLNLAEGLAKSKDVNISIICAGGNAVKKFREKGAEITVKKSFLYKNKSFLDHAKALYFLTGFVKKNKIDIVHSHSPGTAILAHKASRFTKSRIVFTIHELPSPKHRQIFPAADRIIVTDDYIYQCMMKEAIADKAIVKLIRCGVNVPSSPAWKAKTRPKIVAAAGFAEDEDLGTFIRAVSLLPEHDKKSAEFLIAGAGEDDRELRKLNEESGANIKFAAAAEGMPSLLRGTHIFVFSSSSGEICFPSIIAEAAAFNNLVISSNAKGIENVLASGTDGLTFKTADAYDLMIKLKLAIDSYKTFEPMAAHFYYKVKELFDFNTMIQKHMELYNECLRDT